MKRSTCMGIQAIVTGGLAYVSDKFGITAHVLAILMALMVIDYISGMIASAVEALDHPDDAGYGWSSKKGAKGIAKKVGYFFVIVVAMTMDYVVIRSAGTIGFALPTNIRLSLLVSIWYALNEMLSIIENSGRMGAKLPPWLVKYIDILKNKIETDYDPGEKGK